MRETPLICCLKTRYAAAGISACVVVLLLAGCVDKNSRPGNADLSASQTNVALSKWLNEQGMSTTISLDKAIGLFERAIEADAFNASAHNNLGAALLSKGSFYNAAKQFEEAIRLIPSHPQPRTNLGLLYEEVGQLRNAQEQYEQALVVSP